MIAAAWTGEASEATIVSFGRRFTLAPRSTAPPSAPPPPRRHPWQEAALNEGVARLPGPPLPWD